MPTAALLLARIDALAKGQSIAFQRIEALEARLKSLDPMGAHSASCGCIFCAARRMVQP